MSKHLKDMDISELQSGYEKGKVTDEEIAEHEAERYVRMHGFDEEVRDLCKACYHDGFLESRSKLAEHEYQKLKDNE